jgi:hypothetical protein
MLFQVISLFAPCRYLGSVNRSINSSRLNRINNDVNFGGDSRVIAHQKVSGGLYNNASKVVRLWRPQTGCKTN